MQYLTNPYAVPVKQVLHRTEESPTRGEYEGSGCCLRTQQSADPAT